MNRRVTIGTAVVLLAVLSAGSAFGQGMLVPTDRTLPPLGIKSQQVEIAIDNQVATTTVKQVFINSTNRPLEANYVFPMPAEAAIRDFAMMVDGKRTSGELVEAAQARQIYQTIVAQARDPGLLEHLGDNLFRVRIFPVPANGTQSVELSYSQLVPGASGVFRYTYPLKTGGKASQVQDFFSVGVKLASKVPIKSIYSPTHQVGITRKGDHEATVGLELSKAVLDTDFSLYWTVSKDDFGLNAVAYRPAADEDGYLMLLLSPKSAVNADEVIAKDVQFVFDTSGSMGGEKIEQAKKALSYCVENLNAKDRFNIITYATDVTPYKESLIEAGKENKEATRDYIARLSAEGGTNIHGALEKAMETAKAAGAGDGPARRPQVIVFLTDGRPTIGKIGTEEILGVLGGAVDGDVQKKLQDLHSRSLEINKRLRRIAKSPDTEGHEEAQPPEVKQLRRQSREIATQIAELNKQTADRKMSGYAIRIFAFGVGDDVNTHLLDKVAGASGGTSEYVRPGEDIEVKVSDFFAKASHPVMTALKLAFGGGVKVADMFPQSLPDLYFGQQVVALARYRGDGDVSVTLSGTVSTGKAEKHTYEVALPKQSTDNNFIESLWANRKVGYLLDQIRLNGESKELKDEVIRLSKKYKIQTPYTSYLVLEERQRQQYLGDRVAGGSSRGGRDGGWRADASGHGAAPSGPSTSARPAGVPSLEGPLTPPTDVSVAPDLRPPTAPAAPPPAEMPVASGPRPGEKADPSHDRLGRLMEQQRAKRQSEAAGEGNGRGYFFAGHAPTTQPEDEARGLDRDRARWSYDDLKAESGAGAVNLAKDIAEMKRSEQVADGKYAAVGLGKEVAGRTFYSINGFWVDEKFAPSSKLTFVKWGSEAYFAIVTAHEELKDAFALGTRLILVTADGKALAVSETEGAEKLTEQEVKDLFTAAAPTTQPDANGG